MPLKLQRPLVFLDIESTGNEPATDRIIDLALVRWTPADLVQGETILESVWRVHPGRPIPPSSTRIHGITDADVATSPRFESVAAAVRTWLTDCDVAGYNLLGFDLPLLREEFERAEVDWPLEKARVVDAFGIFKRKEPRDLTAAVKKFCGRDHVGAHGALADTQATRDVLLGQLNAYAELADLNVAGLAEFCDQPELDGQPAERVDLAGKLLRTADGVVRYAFGKARGTAVLDDPGFGEWMLRNSFTRDTKRAVQMALNG
jgi:DNA polymerase III subunit epsilon